MRPVPQNHNERCQSAVTEGCDCPCRGMLHQRDILVAAIQSRGTASAFDDEVTNLYGSAFTVLSVDPGVSTANGKKERSRRTWEPVHSASPTKQRSQDEQRAVDTGLGEALRAVHALSPAQKTGWQPLIDQITAESQWNAIATQIQSATGAHDEASGYFWASMLAATVVAGARTAMTPTPAGILSFPTHPTTVFDQSRYPRGGSGNSVKTIKEVNNALASGVSSTAIATALSSATALNAREKLLIVAVTGAVVSADLWKHPCGVKFLLLPTLRVLRHHYGASFSLDSPAGSTERTINEKLGSEWRTRRVW